MNIKTFIMAGGLGSRLWPLSRKSCPKQFLKIFNNRSMIQNTLIRNKIFGKSSIITNKKFIFNLSEQINELGLDADLIIEPISKNTAACAIFSAIYTSQNDLILLLPSDQYISNNDAYISAINEAIIYAKKYGICTIGIRPISAYNEYGYIKKESIIKDNVFLSSKFIEKPNAKKAMDYFNEGNYLWNSGIFIFDREFILNKALELFPNLVNSMIQAFEKSTKKDNLIELDESSYDQIQNISFDKAILENIENIPVIEASFEWTDLGSWSNLWNNLSKNNDQNHINGNVFVDQVTNSYIHSESKPTIVSNLDNIIVINMNDALLVADKSKSANLNGVIANLKKTAISEIEECNNNIKPWGYCRTIDIGKEYKVKHLIIYPNQKLSMQFHNHRSEHWIILDGKAKIELENEIKYFSINDSLYIPEGKKHRISNIGTDNLELIEVQIGKYLGEDDIIRLDDLYNRHKE